MTKPALTCKSPSSSPPKKRRGGQQSARYTTRELVELLNSGWGHYNGPVEPQVYATCGCPDPRQAVWMARGTAHLCLGCGQRCSQGGRGFQAGLPYRKRGEQKVFAGVLPLISAEDMLSKFAALQVGQASYCLNISEREVRNLVDEGVLEVACGGRKPLRVTSASVRAHLDDPGLSGS